MQHRRSPFHVCAAIGLTTGIGLALWLASHQGLSVAVVVVLACAGLLAFLAITMITKVVAGEEVLIYYHDEIAVLAAAAAVLHFSGLSVLPYLDVSVLAVGTLLGFGRLGCFMVGCCHGRPSTWGTRYRTAPAGDGLPTYLVGVRLVPVQLVESAWAFATVAGGVVLILGRSTPGDALAWYTTVYGGGRFVFEFLRGDEGRPYFGLFSEAQWTSFVLMSANGVSEVCQLLPLRPWHIGATVGVAATMLALSLRTASGSRIFRPFHVREMAELIAAARLWTAPGREIHLGRTSLGIQLSASAISDGPRHVEVIAFSSHGPALPTGLAAKLARVIGRLRGHQGEVHLVTSEQGVYRLILPLIRSAHAL
jgi:hypothetical protein